MARLRVYQLAKELGLDSKQLLKMLNDMGEFVRSPSSTLERPVERRVRERFAGGRSLAAVRQPEMKRPPAQSNVVTPPPETVVASKQVPADVRRLQSANGAATNVRVYELAKELGLDSKQLLKMLNDMGEFVRPAQSTLEPRVERRVRERFAGDSSLERAPRPEIKQPTPTSASAIVLARDPVRASTSLLADQPQPLTVSRLGWHAGPVRAPTDPAFGRRVAELVAAFPIAADHLDALSRLGSQFIHISRCSSHGFSGVFLARTRFSSAIETGFGFTRETLFVYSPFVDLQTRLVAEVRRELSNDARLTPDIVFVWSPDKRLRSKLDDWTRPELLLIPLDDSLDETPLAFITLLRDYVYSRDLFYETTPVRGSKFFGRRTLLQELRDDVRSRRVAGVYGLRKAGKTSVMTELAGTVGDDVVPILMDLEALPSPPEDPTPDILADLRSKMRDALKERGLRTKEIADLPETPTITQWKAATQTLLKRLDSDSLRVLLMLDEVEYLSPDQGGSAKWDIPQIAQLLGAFRSLVQESTNFTFMLSGLTSSITENGRLHGRHNPLFSWAKSYYLAPFAREEADDLARTVGAKMGVAIDPDALASLHEGSGGHAFLYRSFASTVVQSLPKDVFGRKVTVTEVQSAYLPWKRGITGHVNEILDHVRRYYPVEALLLEILIEEHSMFRELAEAEPQALHHLLALGLVHEIDHDYALNSLLELM